MPSPEGGGSSQFLGHSRSRQELVALANEPVAVEGRARWRAGGAGSEWASWLRSVLAGHS